MIILLFKSLCCKFCDSGCSLHILNCARTRRRIHGLVINEKLRIKRRQYRYRMFMKNKENETSHSQKFLRYSIVVIDMMQPKHDLFLHIM